MTDLVDRTRYAKEVAAKMNHSPVNNPISDRFPSRKPTPFWDEYRNVDDPLRSVSARKLKKTIREGIPDELRGVVWPKILKVSELREIDRDYERALKAAKLDKPQARTGKFPTYGGEFNSERFALSDEGVKVVKNVLHILSQDYPTLEFCPPLPSIVALLAHHLSPNDLLGSMRILVRESVGAENTGYYFPTRLSTMVLFYDAFGHLLKCHTPKAFEHLKALEEERHGSPFWIKWLNNFCTEVLTLQTALKMMDSYLLEGYKILYRYGIGAIKLRVPDVLKCLSIEQFEELFERNPLSSRMDENDKLSRAAYKLSFSRKDVKKFHDRQLNNGAIATDMFTNIDQFADSRVAPALSESSQFIQEDHWQYVWSWVPKRLKTCDLELLFSTKNHGYFLETLYKRCREAEPQLMFIETVQGAIFGAFLSESWTRNTERNKFFGTAETFLFTLKPKEEKYEWVGHRMDLTDPVQAKQLKENASLFIFGNYQYMAIGGGGLNYGISLDETLIKGTTGTCLTFNNPPLNGNGTTFEIRNVEVYSFKY